MLSVVVPFPVVNCDIDFFIFAIIFVLRVHNFWIWKESKILPKKLLNGLQNKTLKNYGIELNFL
jgi:hypothetical protein